MQCIDLDQPAPGYRRFISAWVRTRPDGFRYLVDPGPRSTADSLLDALAARGVDHLDLVLLTHVHLDHAGGVARVQAAFPGCRVWVCDEGARHVVAPERLWKGSVQVLGDVARMYGEPEPLPADCLVDTDWLGARGIRVIPTPGHASHHVSFLDGDVLFVGEALGTRLDLPGDAVYLRPATPPRFSAVSYLASLDALAALQPEPAVTVFAHHGAVPGLHRWVDLARRQVLAWLGRARALRDLPDARERLIGEILTTDPTCGGAVHAALPPDLQARERSFLRNTTDGILDCVRRDG